MRPELWFYTLPLRLRSLFRRPQAEQDLDEEMQYHLDMQIKENIQRGMIPSEARYAALRKFGGVDRVREECRDKRRVRLSVWWGMRATGCSRTNTVPKSIFLILSAPLDSRKLPLLCAPWVRREIWHGY
jgi:hypothetical protein